MDFQYRILKIDPAPYKSPDEVGAVVGPAVARLAKTKTALEVRGGELADPAFPGHQSYFVGIRFAAADRSATREASEAINELRDESGMRKLPVSEIHATDQAHSRLIRQFGWAD